MPPSVSSPASSVANSAPNAAASAGFGASFSSTATTTTTTAATKRMRSSSRQSPVAGCRRGVVSLRSLKRSQDATVTSAAFVDVGETAVGETKTLMAPPPVDSSRFPGQDEVLPFTVGDLRRAIPPHCFERSVWKSFSYVLRDVVAIGALVYASTFIDALPVAMAVKYGILWPMYWFWVGAFGVGVWIVSHECGHGAFSEYTWLNDLVGFFGHSALMIPYFSWKHSHRRHHANTGSVTYDEAFVPMVAKDAEGDEIVDLFKFSAVSRFVSLALVLVFGFPLYLIGNLGGRKYKGWANHFNPWSPVFLPRERFEVFLSDLGMAAVALGLFWVGQHTGFATIFKTYIIPYFVVHVWLVLITFLHHSHPSCPHYDDSQWSWLKGALSTIDRDFGFLNVIFHRITDTHVVHHLFSQIPHYHALEATEAIKPVLGKYYKQDDRSVLKALWEDFRDTKFVAPDSAGEGVLWYRS